LAAVIALAALARFPTLGLQSFSPDELVTAWLVGIPAQYGRDDSRY
jgi:hypothetical protein